MANVALNIIFGLAGGLALFLYGMKLLSEGLQKAAGENLKNMLESFTNKPLKGILTGAFITSIIQSSSITTVTIVGLINAGLMSLTNAVGVIMGANIGTTITAQLIAFKVGKFALPIIAVGVIFLFTAKKKKYYYLSQIFLGFGILFLGMTIMKDGAIPLRTMPFFTNAMVTFGRNVVLAVIVSAIFTELVQSSSATTAIIITLGSENLIGLKVAIALIIGANIGTCVSAVLASIPASLTARRAAAVHVLFNVVGAIIFLPLINILTRIAFSTSQILTRQIANAHTIFNISTTIVLLPFIPLLIWAAKKIVPGKVIKIEGGTKYLDKRLLNTPAVAISQANKELGRMASLTIEMLDQSISAFLKGKKELIRLVLKKEDIVDSIHQEMQSYLRKISEKPITRQESKRVASFLHTIHDIERVGDHATNIIELAEKKLKSKLEFSKEAQAELKLVTDETIKSYKYAIKAMNKKDKKLAIVASNLEDRIDDLVERFEENHIKRLNKKMCNPASGVLFVEALRNLERVSDHANNIASALIIGA